MHALIPETNPRTVRGFFSVSRTGIPSSRRGTTGYFFSSNFLNVASSAMRSTWESANPTQMPSLGQVV